MIIEIDTSSEQDLLGINSSFVARLKHEIFAAFKSPYKLWRLPAAIFRISRERRTYQHLHPVFEAVHAGWDISIPRGSMSRFQDYSQIARLKTQIASDPQPQLQLQLQLQPRYNDPILQALYDRAANLPSLAKKLERLAAETSAETSPNADLNTIAYVTHVDFPAAQNGYTRRSDAVVKALEYNGITVHRICSRPYIHKSQKDATPNLSLFNRINMAAEALADSIPKSVSTVIAASDWTNGWVAMLAAKKCGLRFAYEVRGQWQLSHAAIVPEYDHTLAFAARDTLERTLAKVSDIVFCQTADLAKYLNVKDTAILIPNGADNTPLKSNARTPKPETLSLGYVGSILPYEGLERAIISVAALHDQYPGLSLTIIGGGSHKPTLDTLVKKLRAKPYIHIEGILPREEALQAQQNFDALILPRHDKQVCHIVEPLKPLEAFSLGKPILATPLRIVKDMPGVLCAKSFENKAFIDLIEVALNHPERLAQAGTAGFQWVQNNRLWNDLLRPMSHWINSPR